MYQEIVQNIPHILSGIAENGHTDNSMSLYVATRASEF